MRFAWLHHPRVLGAVVSVMVLIGVGLTIWVANVYVQHMRGYATDEATWAPLDAERQLSTLRVPVEVLKETGMIDSAAYNVQRDLTLNSIDVLVAYARANESFTGEQTTLINELEQTAADFEQLDATTSLDRMGAELRLPAILRAGSISHRLANIRRQVAEASSSRSIQLMRVASNAQIITLGLLVIAGSLLLWRNQLVHRQSRTVLQRDADLALESQQRRIAHEIHDSVGHRLDAMNLRVAAADLLWDKNPDLARSSLNVAATIGLQARKEVRQAAHALHADYTLTPLEQLLEDSIRTCQLAGIDARFHVQQGASYQLANGVKHTLHRITEEALNNVRHHSGATEVDVTLTYLPRAMQLVIQDNGHGEPPTNNEGNGLPGMRERVDLVSGTITIQPQPGQGYRIEVKVQHDPSTRR